MHYNLITILGPTAVGKTKLATQLADKFNGEIISADSRQVYKGMDIGTGKDLDDYNINGKNIPHYLIDVISPQEEFDLYKFTQLFHSIYSELVANKKIPFLVGGTGLYLHSILSDYKLADVDFNSKRALDLNSKDNDDLRRILLNLKPEQHNKTDLIEKERLIKAILIAEKYNDKQVEANNINSLNIGIRLDRKFIKERITKRLKDRLQSGMIDEVKQLLDAGVTHDKLQFFGLEYKYLSLYLKGEFNYNDMFQKLNSAIHNFAKRQVTWFRKMEKEGIEIHWIEGPDLLEASSIIEREYFGRTL